MRLLRANEHRAMPWKNGRGVTREVAAQAAPNDEAGRFLWRISLATVEGKGDFSTFPGIDRTIAVVSGGGMRLTVDGVVQPEMTALSEPFSFSGEAAVSAECTDGRVTDLNIMTLKGQARHRMERRMIEGATIFEARHAQTALVFAGSCHVSGEGSSFEAAAEDVLITIAKGGRLKLSADSPCAFYAIGVDLQG